MLPSSERLDILSVTAIYQLLSFLVGLALDSGLAALGAKLSFFAFAFFLTRPFNAVEVATTDHLRALLVYPDFAFTTGQLVARVRKRTPAAADQVTLRPRRNPERRRDSR